MSVILRGPKTLRSASVALVLWVTCPCLAPAVGPPIRVLIFTGQNNHDWRQTTPKLKSILTDSGRFVVDATEHPETCDAKIFSCYDVLLSNWNTYAPNSRVKEWPPQMRADFLHFVRDGGGFVVVHAGGAMFPDWTDFQKLIGGTWGKNTGHGPIHTFEVTISNGDHPITRGLAPFQTTDELWHRMAMQPEKTVLATAFSASTGQYEPVAMVADFGKGRCFNLVLGHNAMAMESAGFQALLLRGTEWAATGKVTWRGPSAAAK